MFNIIFPSFVYFTNIAKEGMIFEEMRDEVRGTAALQHVVCKDIRTKLAKLIAKTKSANVENREFKRQGVFF